MTCDYRNHEGGTRLGRIETTRVLLSETGLIVGFRFSGAATLLERSAERALPDSVITGLRLSARRMRTTAGGSLLLAKFHPAGAASFFAEPMHLPSYC